MHSERPLLSNDSEVKSDKVEGLWSWRDAANKSFMTNAISLVLMVLGFGLSNKFGSHLFNMGLFAFSGAITNWLAIHMLFERVPGLYGSGIIPLKFAEFKAGIYQLMMGQFFTKENINRFMDFEAPANFHLDPVIEVLDYDMLFEKLVQAIQSSPLGGMLAMVGGVSALAPLKPMVITKIKEALKEIASESKFQNALKHALAGDLASEAIVGKVSSIVNKRLDELTPDMVKKIIQDMIKSHLGWLVVWGGVFGGLIGLGASLFGASGGIF